MYIPQSMAVHDRGLINRFIQCYSFANLITHRQQYYSTHLPLLLKPNEGEQGYLYSHMVKTNTHWQHIEQAESLVIFNGPHSYISPSWYQHKPAVPTWNYATVHIHGFGTLLNKDETRALINETVEFYEPELKYSDALCDAHNEKLLNNIIGFKLKIELIEGKFKLGLHKHQADQIGVAAGLRNSKSNDAEQLLNFLQSWGYFSE